MASLKKHIFVCAALLVSVLLFNIYGYFFIAERSFQSKSREKAEKITTSQQVLLQQASRSISVLSLHHSFSPEQARNHREKISSMLKRLDEQNSLLNRIVADDLPSNSYTDSIISTCHDSVDHFENFLQAANAIILDNGMSDDYSLQKRLGSYEYSYLSELEDLTIKFRNWESGLNNEISKMNLAVILSLISSIFFSVFVVVAPVFRQGLRNYKNLQESLEEVKESESLLRIVIDSSPDFIYIKDRSHRFKMVNKSMANESGKTVDEYIGKTELDFGIPPEIVFGDAEKGIKGLRAENEMVIATGKSLYIPEERIIVNGKEKVVSAAKSPLVNAQGEVWGVLGYIHDITDRVESEKIIKLSEEKYKQLFNANPMPMWIYDVNTLHFLEVNQMAMEHYGYSAEEFSKMTILDIRPEEDREIVRMNVAKHSSRKELFNNDQWRHMKKDGQEIIVDITSHAINYNDKTAVLVLAKDITENIKLQNRIIDEEIGRQKEFARISIQIQENERNEIGKELHDNVNQILTSAKLQLENIHHSKDQDKTRENSIQLISTAIKEIRILSRSLVPPSLKDIGLISSVRDLIENISIGNIYFDFEYEGINEEKLDESLKLTVFRIIQELTTNILKYSKASDACIKLFGFDGGLKVTVSDNGQGFNYSEITHGLGLSNIINRAELFGGEVIIDSSPGCGSRISVNFKVEENHAVIKDIKKTKVINNQDIECI